MKKELMPIVASYFGQKCSYKKTSRIVELEPYELENFTNLTNFKLHLRKPSQIANEELRTLSGIICGIEYEPEPQPYSDTGLIIKDSDGDSIVFVHNGVIELGSYYGYKFAETTNYLRSIGICVDEVLIKEGLVQFDH